MFVITHLFCISIFITIKIGEQKLTCKKMQLELKDVLKTDVVRIIT